MRSHIFAALLLPSPALAQNPQYTLPTPILAQRDYYYDGGTGHFLSVSQQIANNNITNISGMGPVFNPLAAPYNTDPTGQSAYTAAGGTGTVYVPQGGTLALTGPLTATSGVTTILANGSNVTGGYALPGFQDMTPVGETGMMIGRVGGYAGNATAASANEWTMNVQMTVPYINAQAKYEKGALYVVGETADTSATVGANVVGIQANGVISPSATLATAWGGDSDCIQLTTGTGHCTGWETDIKANHDETTTGEPDSTYAELWASLGAADATAVGYIATGNTPFHHGFVFAKNSIEPTAGGGAIEIYNSGGTLSLIEYMNGSENVSQLSIGGNGSFTEATDQGSNGYAFQEPATNYVSPGTGTIAEEAINGAGNETLTLSNGGTITNLDYWIFGIPTCGSGTVCGALNSAYFLGNIRGNGGEAIGGGNISLGVSMAGSLGIYIGTGSYGGTMAMGGTAATLSFGTALLEFPNVTTGTPSTYACFTSTGQLIKSSTAC